MLSFLTSRVGIITVASLIFALGLAYLQSVKANVAQLEADRQVLINEKTELIEINKQQERTMKDMEAHIKKLNESRLVLEKKRAETLKWTNTVIDQISKAKDEAPVSDALRIAVDEIYRKVKK